MDYILLNINNYQHYTPFDIVAVDVSFRKLYDKAVRVFQLDYDNPPPISEIVNAPAGASLESAFDNDDWLMIESRLVRPDFTVSNKRYIHNSIKDGYLKRVNGKIVWNPRYLYELLVGHQRITLTNENYNDYVPRRMMAFASLYGSMPDYEVIDDYGEWFYLDGISEDRIQVVFPNHKDFTFKSDETFFHMGMGTGMWVDRSIADLFRAETGKIGYSKRGNHILHNVWKELVWKIIKKSDNLNLQTTASHTKNTNHSPGIDLAYS